MQHHAMPVILIEVGAIGGTEQATLASFVLVVHDSSRYMNHWLKDVEGARIIQSIMCWATSSFYHTQFLALDDALVLH